MWGLILLAGVATFAAGLVTVFIVFANGMRSSPGAFVGRGFIALAWIIAAILWLACGVTAASAHDQHRPGLNPWYQSLKSGRGPCCDGSDHKPLPEVDWEKREGRYWVRVEGQWVVVPDDAVLPGPNLDGRTLVWHFVGTSGIYIRCFAPGSMT